MKTNLTGIQACIKSTLLVSKRDRDQNLNTGGFICGYRGSPLAGFDKEIEKNIEELKSHNIEFVYGLNEDLALTAVAGTQQINFFGDPKDKVRDGIVGYWYGKGPGLDRSFDVLHHYNFQGTSKNGGVILFCGDDLECKSSTMPHHSVNSLKSFYVPVLYPSNIEEIFELVLKGVHLSRYSGSFVGIKIITDIADGYQTIDLNDLKKIKIFNLEKNNHVNIDIRDNGITLEKKVFYERIPLMKTFISKNEINKKYKSKNENSIGIICVGYNFSKIENILGKKESYDFDILHLRCSWPLNEEEILEFIKNKEKIIIIEEKDPITEEGIKNILYDNKISLNIYGSNIFKRDLQPTTEEIFDVLKDFNLIKQNKTKISFRKDISEHNELKRFPYFCGGCPYNNFTKIPENSKALLGIGCHYLAKFVNNNTISINPMGYEGSIWVSIHKFLNDKNHVFVNLGDGTYFHSGILSIRFCVANKVPLTFKIFFNGVVGMTGGQNIDGDLSLEKLVDQLLSEGIKNENIAIISNYYHEKDWSYFHKKKITVFPKQKNIEIQEKFRKINDVSVIIYDQMCATEKKRRIKRGIINDENQTILINSDICDGCGDCQEKSSCLGIENIESENFLYKKRRINQSVCGLDKSCVSGFCPSFIVIKKDQYENTKYGREINFTEKIRNFYYKKDLLSFPEKYKILIKGIGGNGTSTLNKIISDSFLDQGYDHINSLDQTGLSQRNGEVYGFIKAYKTAKKEDFEFNYYDLAIFFDYNLFLSELKNLKAKNMVVNTNIFNDHYRGNHYIKEEIYKNILKKYSTDETNILFVDFSKIMDDYNISSKNLNLVILGFCYEKDLIPVDEKILLQHIEKNIGNDHQKYFIFGRFLDRMKKTENEENKIKIEDLLFEYDHKSYKKYLVYRNIIDEKIYNKNLNDKLKKTIFDLIYKKDEFEVSRLWLKFLNENQIHNGTIYLSPPGFRYFHKKIGIDVRIAKILFLVMNKVKFLRNSFLNIFNLSKDEKIDQEYRNFFLNKIYDILSYQDIISADKIKELESICNIIKDIRGYGHIRAKRAEKILNIFRK
ncbi:MAG: DUF6537 domain-containing protein [Candidatus Aenigmatarchaeota archaeon]